VTGSPGAPPGSRARTARNTSDPDHGSQRDMAASDHGPVLPQTISSYVGAVIAVPSLLAGRNIAQSKSDWSPNGLLVLTILFLFGACVAFERLWCKKARECHGWKEPLFKGILPPALCGFLALGVALALGTTP
jgi:hypothetical protein